MKCNKYEYLISGYIDGELNPKKEKFLLKHLYKCDFCRDKHNDFNAIKNSFSEMQVPEPNLEEWGVFNDNLFESIKKINEQKKPKSFYSTFYAKVASILIIITISIFYILLSNILPGFFKSDKTTFSLKIKRLHADRRERNNITHNPILPSGNVPDYTVKNNIKGLKKANLTKKEFDFLRKYGFVATTREHSSFYSLYNENQSRAIPSFITTDAAISGLSNILSRLIVDIEEKVFLNKLSVFTTVVAEQLIELYEEIPKSIKKDYFKALAFTKVASNLLDLKKIEWPEYIESKIKTTVEKEMKLIYNGRNYKDVWIQKSPIFGYSIDYSRFKITWDMTQNEKLRRYYQAREWYARCVFRYSNKSETRTALLILMSALASGGDGIIFWEEIREVITALNGETDDLHLLEYLQVAREVYGDFISIESLKNKIKLERFCRKLSKVRLPRISSELGLQGGLRIFGYIFYSRNLILQKLTYPYVGARADPRHYPSILDIAVIMGSKKAWKIAEEKGFFSYNHYKEKINKYKNRLKKNMIETPWYKGGFVKVAWLYKALLQPDVRGYPFFMRSEAWNARKLTTILCGSVGFANGKAVFTGKGKYSFDGTVDPYPEFFNRMSTYILTLEQTLKKVGYPTDRSYFQEIQRYRKTLAKIAIISNKTLMNKTLTHEDKNELRDLVLGWNGSFNEPNIKQLSILMYRNDQKSDFHHYVGVGPVREIWVAINDSNGQYLVRGGIYILCEFPTTRKMTPELWRKKYQKSVLKKTMGSWQKEYMFGQ